MKENNDLKIIFEDKHLLIVDKPPGLVVNVSNTYKEKTLQEMISEKYPDLWEGKRVSVNSEDVPDEYPSSFKERNGIVHRLDKNTSGVIVVAKEEETFLDLQKQFKNREVEKFYSAIVHGKVKDQEIEIEAPIGRNPKSPFKFAVVAEGKQATTYINVVANLVVDNKDLTYISIRPRTGRTHQIRVHLSALGHPVVHDYIYGSARDFEWSGEVFGRLMLHATKLVFKHPVAGEQVSYSSDLPVEFKRYIDK
jgi:23S rRNA pseudouridine1911/1915/1917 synthase